MGGHNRAVSPAAPDEADEDAFDSYIGLGGDAEPEAYSRGRRYDRLHSDRKKRARRREYRGKPKGIGVIRRLPRMRSVGWRVVKAAVSWTLR